MKKSISIILFIFASIGLFGQGNGAINNRYVETKNVIVKTLMGDSTRLVSVDSTGKLIPEIEYRIKLSDSTTVFATPHQLSTSVPKGASGTVLVGKGTSVNAEFSSTLDGKLSYGTRPVLTSDLDIPCKADIDAAALGIIVKDSVSLATTSNIDLAGAETIDGISTVNGMSVLVKNQTDSIQNGIYIVASGSWTRRVDDNEWSELKNGYYLVSRGVSSSGASYVCAIPASGTVGVNKVWFNNFAPPTTSIVAGDGIDKSGNTISVKVSGDVLGSYNNGITINNNSITDQYVWGGISATKIGANTNISNAEYNYLDGLTGNIQAKFGAKLDTSLYSTIPYNSTTWDGSQKTLTQNAARDKFELDRITWAGNVRSLSLLNTDNHVIIISNKLVGDPTWLVLPYVTSTLAGFMKASDYIKFATIQQGAEVNVQSDLATTDVNSDSYIKNKSVLLLKSDTATVVPTTHDLDSIKNNLLDSINNIQPGDTSLFTLSGTTITPKTGNFSPDTVTMGENASVYSNYATYGNCGYYCNGSSQSALTANTIRYVFNETGQYRYKIMRSGSTVYKLMRSTNNGVSWDTLRTVHYSTTANTALKCSNYGDVVAYTEYYSSANTLYVSTDYGSEFTAYTIGTGLDGMAIDISDNGIYTAVGAYESTGFDSIYIHKGSSLRCQGRVMGDAIPFLEDIKVANDSTIYYTVKPSSGNAWDRQLYEVSANGTHTLKKSGLALSDQFDLENGVIYVSDSTKLYSSTDGGATLTLIKDLLPFRMLSVNASKDGTYIYLCVLWSDNSTYYTLRSTDSGANFSIVSMSVSPAQFDQLEINESLVSEKVQYSFRDGRLNFNSGGITLAPNWVATNSNDVLTLGQAQTITSGIPTRISTISTSSVSFLSGGSSNSTVPLSLSFINGNNPYPPLQPMSDYDKLIISDSLTGYSKPRFIYAGKLKAYLQSGMATGNGTVTSVNPGNGMNFTAITGVGVVTLGTPSNITRLTGNSAYGTTHSHYFDSESFYISDLGGIGMPSTTGLIPEVTSFTSGNPNITWVAKPTSGGGSLLVKESGGTAITTTTLEFMGATVSDQGSGVTRVIVPEVEEFNNLSTSGAVSWSWFTTKNMNIPAMTGNISLTITDQLNGQSGELWVFPNSTTDYTLTFNDGINTNYFANDHSNIFNIEHGSYVWCFTFKSNGTIMRVDYATYKN